MTRGPAMTALRDGTHALHEQTDHAVRDGDWFSSPAAYVELLKRNLGFHRIVESVVDPYIPDLCASGWQWRPRSPLLEGDLRNLLGADPGYDAADDWSTGSLVADGRAGAVGVLYVVEGSALGGRVLARWIQSRLGYDGVFGASSFLPYGPDPGDRWRAFGVLAERTARAWPDQLAAMVAAARATFEVHAAIIGSAELARPVPAGR